MTKKFRIVSLLLTAVLLMSVYVTPAAAAQGNGRGQERGREGQRANRIQYLDAEVQVINGQPMLRYETESGYTDIPFELPTHALSSDGQEVAVKREGDAILLPTEDGLEAVLLKNFSVVMVGGQIMLLAEVNPAWKLIPAAVGIVKKAQLLAALSAAGLRGFTATVHFIERLVLRRVATADVVTVLSTGQRFFDTVERRRVVFHPGLRMAVVIDKNKRVLVTVMDDVNILRKTRSGRWVPQNWSW